MKTYAFEYLTEDAEIEIIMFNKNGITERYISQGIRGKYEEPKNNQVYLCLVEGDYTNNDGEHGHIFKHLQTMSIQDTENNNLPALAYELIDSFIKKEVLEDLCEDLEND